MRGPGDNIINNAMSAMNNAKKTVADNSANKVRDYEDISIEKFRSGSINTGALQLFHLINSEHYIVGESGNTTTVGA